MSANRRVVANPSASSSNDRPTVVMAPADRAPEADVVKAGNARKKAIVVGAIVVVLTAVVVIVLRNLGEAGNRSAVREDGPKSLQDSIPRDGNVSAAASEPRGSAATSLPFGPLGRDLARPGGPDSMVARRYREALDRKAAGKYAEAAELLKVMYQRNPRFDNVIGEYASTLLLLSEDQIKRGEPSAAVTTARTAAKVEDSEKSRKALAAAEEVLRNELKSPVTIEAAAEASALGVGGVVLKGTSTYRPSTKLESGGQSVAVVDGRFTIDVEVPREVGRGVDLRIIDVATGVESKVVFRFPIRRNRK